MATVKICDICGKRTYPIETFSWITGKTQTGIDSAEDIYDTYDVCVVCLCKFFFHFIKFPNLINEELLNNELIKYISKKK
jgi:hypothetical protein